METDSAAEAGLPHLLRLQATTNYRSDFASPSLAASFKLDEGYSDETRSQPDHDAKPSPGEAMTLPDWVLAHSEAERAGKSTPQPAGPCSVIRLLTSGCRACVQSAANPADLHHRRRGRTPQAPPPHGPGPQASARDHCRDLFLPRPADSVDGIAGIPGLEGTDP